jgi:hypothetical protein
VAPKSVEATITFQIGSDGIPSNVKVRDMNVEDEASKSRCENAILSAGPFLPPGIPVQVEVGLSDDPSRAAFSVTNAVFVSTINN